jgi:hypothetical protein
MAALEKSGANRDEEMSGEVMEGFALRDRPTLRAEPPSAKFVVKFAVKLAIRQQIDDIPLHVRSDALVRQRP